MLLLATSGMLSKTDLHRIKTKSRLLACGFEDNCLIKCEKGSLTCSKQTFYMMLVLTIQNNWELTAFLQGLRIDREVFVIPPPEANTPEGYRWKLSKRTYGLSDASLKWYSRVKSFVNGNSGAISIKVDPSLFSWYNESNELIGYILVYVHVMLCYVMYSLFKVDS